MIGPPPDPPFDYKYVTYGPGGEREKIICRKCHETIAAIIDVSATTDPLGNITIRQAFKLLPNYTKVSMLLTNGTKIESAICKGCAKWMSATEIDKLYESEILAIEYDAEVHNSQADTKPIVDQLRTQRVVRRIG